MSVKTTTLLTAVSALALPSSVAGWWDEGHMLPTAIAKSLLSEATVKKYENVLKCSDSQGEWANFTELVRATVWMDHARCTPSETGDRCAGISPQNRHGLSLMDDWRSDETPWKPEAKYSNVTLPKSGYNKFASDAIGKVVSALRERPTSAWSLAYHLRVFLNVFTNLHQRLNTGEYYDDVFPNGRGQYELKCLNQDEGSNGMPPGKCADIPGVTTFHDLYESGCGGMTKGWPELVKDDNTYVRQRAADLLKAHPAQNFIDNRDRLSPDWNNADKNYGFGNGSQEEFQDAIQQIADDSLNAFGSIFQEHFRDPDRDDTYAPSFIKISICRTGSLVNQTAVGGYRLASWLNALAQYIPDEAPCDLTSPETTTSPDEEEEKDWEATIVAYRWGIFGAAALTFVIGGGVGYAVGNRKNAQNNNELEAGLAGPQVHQS